MNTELKVAFSSGPGGEKWQQVSKCPFTKAEQTQEAGTHLTQCFISHHNGSKLNSNSTGTGIVIHEQHHQATNEARSSSDC